MTAAYVYAIVVDGVVRYIGKGSGKRAWRHLTTMRSIARRRERGDRVQASYLYNRLVRSLFDGCEILVRILAGDLSEQDALKKEAELIALQQHQLWNTRPGGEGLTSADAIELRANPAYRARVSAMMKSLWTDKNYRDQMKAAHENRKGKHLPHFSDPDYRAKKKQGAKKQWSDPVVKDRMVSSLRLANASMDVRERKSAAVKATWADPEIRAKRCAAMSAARRRSLENERTNSHRSRMLSEQ